MSPGVRQATRKYTRGKGETVHFKNEDQFWLSLYGGPNLATQNAFVCIKLLGCDLI